MLELKDVCVLTVDGKEISSLSFSLQKGELVSLFCVDVRVAHSLLQAMVGLCAVKSGYITLHGECITPLSAPFLRQEMAYFPLQLQALHTTTEELFTQIVQATKKENVIDEKQLLVLWRDKKIPKNHFTTLFNQLNNEDQQRVLLSFASLLQKDITLIAVPDDTQTLLPTSDLLSEVRSMANNNQLVILATNNEEMANGCNKRININII